MTTGFHRKSAIRGLIMFIVAIALAGGCSMPLEWETSAPDSGNDPSQGGDGGDSEISPQILAITGEEFSLAWDSDAAEVIAHRVYVREYGSSEWRVLADRVTTARHRVNAGDLPFGTYEFAVSSLNAEGEESDLHHSFDPTADPEPWILEWTAS